MKLVRIMMFSAAMLFAMSAVAQPPDQNPDPGGGGTPGGSSCQTCRSFSDATGDYPYCGSPDTGAWGNQYCTIDSFPEAAYCTQYGNPCCVD